MIYRCDVTLLTCTGYREKAFNLCQNWVARLDRGPLSVEWIVVHDELREAGGAYKIPARGEDGKEMEVRFVCGVDDKTEFFSMLDNVEIGIANSRGQLIVIVEDDDWYSEDYLYHLWNAYSDSEGTCKLIGYARGYYYNINNSTWFERDSSTYASLCRTAFDRSLIHAVRSLVRFCTEKKSVSLDLSLWQSDLIPENRKVLISNEEPRCVSVKGLPGRSGAGSLHNARLAHQDQMMVKLSEWIGHTDTELYEMVLES